MIARLPRAVIFDMDGLTLDTEELSFRMWQTVAAERNYALTREIFISVVGLDEDKSHQIFRDALGADFPAEELRALKVARTDQFAEQKGIPVKSGIVELLTLLKQHSIPAAIATGTYKEVALRRLTSANLINEFSVIAAKEQGINSKPAPDLYLKAVKDLGIPAAECLALEDSSSGVEAAYRAGVPVIMVPDMLTATEIDRERAVSIIANVELVRISLMRLLSTSNK